MNAITKTHITVEHHCLQMSYESLRMQKRQWVEKLALSMEHSGQLVPVVIVPKENGQWILIDGYLRVEALRRIGKDVVDAEVWNCDERAALVMLLTVHQSRPWEALEEALLLHELHTQHGLSQNYLANKIGRDQSWVSRRLSLVEQLSDPILHAIAQGKLSVWSAVRIVGPMARAMPEHAGLLLQHILKQALSTRELKGFYDHYQQSSQPQRYKMVNEPELFFKAQKLLMMEKETQELRKGPEGKWHSQLNIVRCTLTSLLPIVAELFASYQDNQISSGLIKVLHDCKTQLDLLIQTTRSFTDAYERYTADDYQPTPKGKQ